MVQHLTPAGVQAISRRLSADTAGNDAAKFADPGRGGSRLVVGDCCDPCRGRRVSSVLTGCDACRRRMPANDDFWFDGLIGWAPVAQPSLHEIAKEVADLDATE